jgi:hypothetical protein
MSCIPRHIFSGWLLLIFFTLFAESGQSQDTVELKQWQRGFEGFEMVSKFVELESVDESGFAIASPKETVLVVLGSLHRVSVVDSFLSKGGAVLVASDQASGRDAYLKNGVKFFGRSVNTRYKTEGYLFNRDCPVIRDLKGHPSLEGVTAIASNRPGMLSAGNLTIVARFPELEGTSRPASFAVADETENGGRILAIADQSLFTNQMITAEDNDLFAYQALLWLKDSKRKYVHFVVNGTYKRHDNVEDVELPPVQLTPDEIREILAKLPPEKLLAFGNQLAADVEDKDLINKFIREKVDGISDSAYNRGLIWALFFGVCITLMLAFLWQKRLLRRTASAVALDRHLKSKKNKKGQVVRDRQWAANLLLDSFCRRVESRGYRDWPSFPAGLSLHNNIESERIYNEMIQASNDFKTKPAGYWTKYRLLKLESDVSVWLTIVFENRGEQK